MIATARNQLLPVATALASLLVLVCIAPVQAAPQESDSPSLESTAVPIESGKVQISPENTRIQFTGTHVGEEPKPRIGGFEKFEGYFEVDSENQLVKSVRIEFDVSSIWTEFDKLTKHLKTADFFDAEKYPTAAFTSRSIESGDDGALTITGELFLHGTNSEISIPAKYEFQNGGLILHGQFTLDRTAFGMDKMTEGVESSVTLEVVVGVKQNAPAEEEMAATELVRLKLPNMHCGGCAAVVRESLEKVESVSEIEFDIDSQQCQFKCTTETDVTSLLDELAKSRTQFHDWSRVADDDGKP